MIGAVKVFQEKQQKVVTLIETMKAFSDEGLEFGLEMEAHLRKKIADALVSAKDEKLKVVLTGGVSEGKTTIAAAWLGKLDKSTMKISAQESSDDVNIYQFDDNLMLVDTPGLFGYKEKYAGDNGEIKKYKEITKEYISQAHLMLYVMNSANPIKESHQEELLWLFRDLGLLPRTVFILSRFDEVADVDDEDDYQVNLFTKKKNVVGRLKDLIQLTNEEETDLVIVGVAANPFESGLEYWLTNFEEFQRLSHIASLQEATTKAVEKNEGAYQVILEAKKTILKEFFQVQLPLVQKQDDLAQENLESLKKIHTNLSEKLLDTEKSLTKTRIKLRDFISNYFSDLIRQAHGVSLETARDFIEREIGKNSIILTTHIQNEFERQIGLIDEEFAKLSNEFKLESTRYDAKMIQLGRLIPAGIGGKINGQFVLKARDFLAAGAGKVGINFGKALNFKPFGAIQLAGKLNVIFAALPVVIELVTLVQENEKQDKFDKDMKEFIANLEEQREQYINMLGEEEGILKEYFSECKSLQIRINKLGEEITNNEEFQNRIRNWIDKGRKLQLEFGSID